MSGSFFTKLRREGHSVTYLETRTSRKFMHSQDDLRSLFCDLPRKVSTKGSFPFPVRAFLRPGPFLKAESRDRCRNPGTPSTCRTRFGRSFLSSKAYQMSGVGPSLAFFRGVLSPLFLISSPEGSKVDLRNASFEPSLL